MSQYIVSARKYRPDSFETLIGQDTIARTLSNSIKRGQLAHAYLFCGPRGVGKTTTARIFAKMINCSDPGPDMEPCGRCESCVSFQEGRSYCIHEMDAASNNSVEDMKALMDKVQVPPQVGKYSVYIIDEVHMLSQSAFNAFLKTLEEPPAHAIFILATTEKHKILPTILSRCQTYDFNRISVSDIVRNLRGIAGKEGVSIDDESLHVIAMKADGAMRDALTIFDQTVAFCGTQVRYEDVIRNLNVLDYEYGFSLVDRFLAGDYAKALLTFDEVLSKGFNALHFVASLSSHLRNLIVAQTGGLDALLELPGSLKSRYAAQASRCPLKFLYEALGVTTGCEAGYKAAVNPRLHIEFALMRLSFLCGLPATASVPAAAPSAAAAGPALAAETPASASLRDPVRANAPSGVPAAAPSAAAASSSPAADTDPSAGKTDTSDTKAASNPVPASGGTGDGAFARTGSRSDAESPVSPEAKPEPKNKPEPEEKPVARRRKRSGGALSIDALVSEKEESPVEEAPADTAAAGSLTEEKMAEGLKTLAGLYAQSLPRLASLISTARSQLSEEDGVPVVTLFVLNVAQKQWIEEKKLRELRTHLCRITSLPKLNIAVDVEPVEESGKKVYLPEDQAKILMSQNKAVHKLVTDLGLDVK